MLLPFPVNSVRSSLLSSGICKFVMNIHSQAKYNYLKD